MEYSTPALVTRKGLFFSDMFTYDVPDWSTAVTDSTTSFDGSESAFPLPTM
ncbi:hypothetical protein W823_14680 [Williamsia sp. D3]|nr:hypothetical protein W823_14680 [Williamsia sp. D3]